MSKQTVIVETPIPEDVYLTLQALGLFKDALAERSRRLLAMRFYQDRVLSLGKAARLAGVDRWTFVDILSENGVPVIDYGDEELAAEFDAARRLTAELTS